MHSLVTRGAAVHTHACTHARPLARTQAHGVARLREKKNLLIVLFNMEDFIRANVLKL